MYMVKDQEVFNVLSNFIVLIFDCPKVFKFVLPLLTLSLMKKGVGIVLL